MSSNGARWTPVLEAALFMLETLILHDEGKAHKWQQKHPGDASLSLPIASLLLLRSLGDKLGRMHHNGDDLGFREEDCANLTTSRYPVPTNLQCPNVSFIRISKTEIMGRPWGALQQGDVLRPSRLEINKMLKRRVLRL